jgi:hypothetical protein
MGMMKIISVSALANNAATKNSTLTLIKGALKLMARSNAKTVTLLGLGVLLAAGTTMVAVNKIQKHESQKPSPIIMIGADNSIRVISPSQINQLNNKKHTSGVAFSIGFKTGEAREATIHRLEQIHATVLKNTPELLLAEFEKTPARKNPVRVELDFTDGKLARVDYIIPPKTPQ